MRMEAWAKSGGGRIMGHAFSLDWKADRPKCEPMNTNCGLGAAQQCAKQKLFGTLLAMAPSPVFYWTAKNSHGQLGDFFAALKKAGEERGGRAGYQKPKALRSLAQIM